MKLTEKTVRAAQCPPGQRDKLFFDGALPGFGLRVTSSGAKVFLIQYNVGVAKRRTALGTWGTELTVEAARRKAEVLRGQIRDRRDPVAERRAARAATMKAEVEAKAAAAAAAYTVETLIGDWAAHHLAGRSASYARRVPVELRSALKLSLAAPAHAFDRADAVRVLDTVKRKSGPVAANRLRAEARSCWTWAVKRGTLTVNPWSATPRPLARETPRERVLTDAELAALYSAAGTMAEPFDVLIRMLILTGQRRGEVAGMRWAELALEVAEWRLPGSRTKNRQAHVVPLPPIAVELLRSVKRREGSAVVFEGPRQTSVSGFGKAKSRLDKAMPAGSAPWTVHDIRRTVATGLQRLGIRLEVTEALLNHVSGSRSGIVGVYQRHAWVTEKRAALDGWANHVLAAAAGIARSGVPA